jgi:hypothetical protein
MKGTSVLNESKRQLLVVVEAIQNLVVRIATRAVRRILESSHEDNRLNTSSIERVPMYPLYARSR